MLKIYIKMAFRNIFRNKTYAMINIVGLAMGISAFLLLLEYISLEKSVNQFHKNIGSMYRLINEDREGKTWPEAEPGWAVQASQRYPEIKDYCLFDDGGAAKGVVSVSSDPEKVYREESIAYAEGNFFNVFSFPLVSGNSDALAAPNTVFISATSAKKYFGNKDPNGETLTLNNQFGTTVYKVVGVYKDMGDNSDLHYDMVFSLETLKNPANLNGNSWASLDNESLYLSTVFLLNKTTNIPQFEHKLTNLRNELKADKDGVAFRLQAFKDMHLGSSFNDNLQTSGNLKYIYMLGGIATLILLIAWFNYVNLSTATSFKRANEVGVRKVIGASRSSLVKQFMSESLLINLIGLLAAIGLVELIQPLFNTLVGKSLSLLTLGATTFWMYGLGLLIGGSVLSGAYAAFSLSKFNPVNTLKGKINKTAQGLLLRKSLVVSQFVISISLIIATILIYSQLNYMRGTKLGVTTNQMLVIRGPEMGKDSTYKNRRTAFWNSVAAESFVKDYCATGTIPGGWYNFMTSGFTQPASKKGDEVKTYAFAIVGDRFLNTYGLQLVAGRNFTPEECAVEWSENSKVLMNETAIKQLGFKNAEAAVRTKIQWDERALQIIGVVKDYHHTSVQRAIDPMIFYPQNNNSYFTVKLTPDKMQEKIASLEKLYKQSFADNPFDYFFVDEVYNRKYANEQQYGNIFSTAAIWAIFIACLGLFGLATFTVESRVKEIGVRKVLGASVQSIVSLLSKDFLLLVFIAFVIATPIAWYAMHQWLQDFASRITIGWWVFVLAGGIALVIALVTVSFQAIKAAVANPVKSLRTE